MLRFIVCQQPYFELLKNRCAAELLYFFKQQREGWFIITIEELQDKFFGTWGKDAIRKGLSLLNDLNLVIRRHTRLNGRAWEYKFLSDNSPTVVDSSPTVSDNPTTVVDSSPTVSDNPTITYIQDPILDPSSDPEKDPNNECVGEKNEMSEEEIRAAIAQSLEITFTDAVEQPPVPPTEPEEPAEKPTNSKHDLTPFFDRLRAIDVPLSGQIRKLLTKHPEERLHKNITALEEESAKNGLKNPIASCIAAITRNWIPKLDPQTWWDAASRALGRERRDNLIQNVTWLSISPGEQEVFIIYKTGIMLKLRDAYGMNWDEIANYGSVT